MRVPPPRARRDLCCLAAFAWLGVACGGDGEPSVPVPEAGAPSPGAVPAPPPVEVTEWGIDPSSKVGFTATKEGPKDVAGTLALSRAYLAFDPSDLAATRGALEVGLSSVATGDPTRDDNIRKAFFEASTPAFATARLVLERVAADVPSLPAGASARATADGKLSLHGAEAPVSVKLEVTRPDEATLLVRTSEPFVLDVSAFGMEPRRRALMKLCGHVELAATVPVTVDLKLRAKGSPVPTPPDAPAPASGEAGGSAAATP